MAQGAADQTGLMQVELIGLAFSGLRLYSNWLVVGEREMGWMLVALVY